jgi:1,4-alpha-glucan branching enzyme
VIATCERRGLPLEPLEPLDASMDAKAAPDAVPPTSWGAGRDLRTWSAPAAGGLPWTQRAAELRALTGQARPSDRALRELLALQSSDWAFLIAAGTAGPYPRERAAGHLVALEAALADPDMDPALRNLAPWV